MREWVGWLLHYFLASLLLSDSGLSSFQSLWGCSRWNRKRNAGWESILTGTWLSSLLLSEHDGSPQLILFWEFLSDSLLETPTWQVPRLENAFLMAYQLRLFPHPQGILVLVPLVLVHPLRLQLDKTLFKTTQTNFPLQGAHLRKSMESMDLCPWSLNEQFVPDVALGHPIFLHMPSCL